MKKRLMVVLVFACAVLGFTACTTAKSGCHVSSGMVGYK